MKKLLTVVSIFLLLLVVGGCGKKEFTITFDTAGGSKIETIKVKKGDTLKEPDEPTRKGYTFTGWELDDEEFDFETKITKNITLKATWKKNSEKYTVTFNSNGGSQVDSIEVSSGGKVNQPTSPTRNGYTFVRWELNGIEYDFSKEITRNITLVAVWQSNVTSTSNVVSKTSLTELKELKELVSTLNEVEYTTATWSLLKASLNLKETTQAEVNNKINAIKSAINALETIVDLEEAINLKLNDLETLKQNYLNQGDYTDASWNILQTAFTNVENGILASQYIQVANNYSFNSINSAIAGLETVADLASAKADVKTLIDEYIATLVKEDYTTETYEEFETAIANIKTYVDSLLWISEVSEYDYETAIEEAMSDLEFSQLGEEKIIKIVEILSELFEIEEIALNDYSVYGDDFEAIMEAIKNDLLSKYTEYTVTNLFTTIETSTEEILASTNESYVTNYDFTAVTNAIGELETILALSSAIADKINELYVTYVNELTEDDYDSEDWAVFTEVVNDKEVEITECNTIAEVDAITFTEVENAKTTLEETIIPLG